VLCACLAAACSSANNPTGGDDTPPGDDDDIPPGDAPPAQAKRTRFIAIGDAGKGNATQREVAVAMRDVCAAKGCDFVLMLGDNIYDAGVDSITDSQWQTKFEEPYHDIDLPFYVALGNHDNGGNLIIDAPGIGNEFDKGKIEVDYTAVSTKWTMPATHYTFTAGNVGFIVLDTNSILWGDETYGDQAAWLPSALVEVADKRWIFTAGHHPYRSNGQHGSAGDYDAPELGGMAAHARFDTGLVVIVTVIAVAGSFAGTRLGRRISPQHLQVGFGAFVILVGLLILLRELP
jgi:hypothetical protein